MLKRAHVRLYTRPGCHLCEEMLRKIQAANCADEYELEEINIDEDPALKETYGTQIPVLTINGKEAFRYRLNASDFREQIRAANLA